MIDFEIQRSNRRCSATDREFLPGETFYSVLVGEGADVVRRDYSAEAWEGPPEGAIGWWRCQAPEPHARKPQLAPSDVLREYFQSLEGQPEKADVRYVLALLMVRRRVVRLEDTDTDAEGREVLVLFCPRDEVTYQVATVPLKSSRVQAIQDELARLLYADNGARKPA